MKKERLVKGLKLSPKTIKRIRREAKRVRGNTMLERRFMGRFWKTESMFQECGGFIIFREASQRGLLPDEPIIHEHRTSYGLFDEHSAYESCELYDRLVDELELDPSLRIDIYRLQPRSDQGLFDDLFDIDEPDDLSRDLFDDLDDEGLFDF